MHLELPPCHYLHPFLSVDLELPRCHHLYPCLPVNLVTEELPVGETTAKRSELVGAHKFVLAMVSDVFKDQFLAHNVKEVVEISLTGVSIEAFKEFLKLLYSLFISNWKDSTIKAKDRTEVLNLCKKYKVDDAVSFIEHGTVSFKTDGCIKQEFRTAKKSLNVEKIQGLLTKLKTEEEIDDKQGLVNKLKTEEEIDDKKEIKIDLYCILCQEDGHMIRKECISCLSCGIKGHTRRDCIKEEYIEMEIAEDNPKTEGNNLTTHQDHNTIEDGALQVGISTPNEDSEDTEDRTPSPGISTSPDNVTTEASAPLAGASTSHQDYASTKDSGPSFGISSIREDNAATEDSTPSPGISTPQDNEAAEASAPPPRLSASHQDNAPTKDNGPSAGISSPHEDIMATTQENAASVASAPPPGVSTSHQDNASMFV